MALNTSDKNGGLLIYNGERIFLFVKKMEFVLIDDHKKEMKGDGQLFLTSHRIVFLNLNKKDQFRSFSIPFSCMDKVELKQPVLGANYIEGHVMAQPNGNWNGTGKFKLTFTTGGATDFGRALLNAAQRMLNKGGPPPYEPPPPPFNPAAPGMYVAPPDANVGFPMPTNMFPPSQINEPILVSNAPPPYPGIYPPLPDAPPYSGAAGEGPTVAPAYYDPQNPQNMYVPPHAAGVGPSSPKEKPARPPPPYEEEKKNL